MNRFISDLEDAKKSFLGPTKMLLNLAGLWIPQNIVHRFFNLIMIGLFVVFVTFEYIDLAMSWGQWDRMLKNISFTFAVMMCLIKIILFKWNSNHWKQLFDLIDDIEFIYNDKGVTHVLNVLENYATRLRQRTIAYIILASSTIVLLFASTLIQVALSSKSNEMRPQICMVWMPFSQESTFGYSLNILCQIMAILYAASLSVVYDAAVISIMMWLTCQLELLRFLCAHLTDSGPDDVGVCAREDEVVMRIAKVQKFHLSLLKCYRMVNALQSWTMFVNLLVSVFMIGATVVSLVQEQHNTVQFLTRISYLVTMLTELAMLYWFCNEVVVKCEELTLGMWESEWWRYGVRVRRCILILMNGLNIPIIFTAGPFNKITISQFVAILKMTYSAYAALINTT